VRPEEIGAYADQKTSRSQRREGRGRETYAGRRLVSKGREGSILAKVLWELLAKVGKKVVRNELKKITRC
jgi:hypothetical protein